MGFFDSKSTTKTTQNNRAANLADVDGLAVVGGEGALNLNLLDSGAVSASISAVESVAGQNTSLARDAVREIGDNSRDAFDFGTGAILAVGAAGEQAGRNTLDISRAAIAAAERAQRSDSTVLAGDLFKYGAIAAGVLGVAYLMRGKL